MSSSVSHPELRARVRVYLPTYRRHILLPRAVAALRAQTLTDWTCELHNDDPADLFPAELVRQIGDSRIQLFNHEQNLGPIASFNLFYRETSEPFYALLEDDNSWDPNFLAILVQTLERNPEATLAWCNQRVEHEQPDGTLRETERLVNPEESTTAAARLIPWGQWRQAMGAIHANGAMMIRSLPDRNFPTPQILFGGMEAFRERLLPHPLVYVPQALATYTITQRTARDRDLKDWGGFLVALAATYLRHAKLSTLQFTEFWKHFAEQRPPMTNELIATALICAEARPLLKHARTRDWFRFARSCVRRPTAWWHTLRTSTERPEWWRILDHHTAERFAELKIQTRFPP